MLKKTTCALLLAGLSASLASAAPGDYDPAYEQNGGYGAVTLDERVAKLEKKLSGDSQTELLNRMEQLQADVLRLRGEVEELTHRLDTARRQQKEQYLDLDRRVQALTPPPPPVQEQPATPGEAPTPDQDPNAQPPANSLPTQQPPVPVPAPAPAAPTPTPAPAVPATPAQTTNSPRPYEPPKLAAPTYAVQQRPTPPSVPSADSEARQAAYLKGFNVFKDGKYAEAIKEFKSFLNAYPKGEYADSATYWLAESQYVNRDLAAARESFRKVVRDYPQAAKASDAQLKLGYIDYDAGQWGTARESLSEVVKRYPDSSAAKLAQKRLDKMKQEGH